MCRICEALGQRVNDDGSITNDLPRSGEDPLEVFADEWAEPRSFRPRIGRNELCPCGSGKKFKRCCL